MKITPADVETIRARRAAGEKLLAIALDYGVTEPTIKNVVRGRFRYDGQHICSVCRARGHNARTCARRVA